MNHPLAALRALASLCLLQRGPEDLPYSPALTWGWLGALLGLQWWATRNAGFDPAIAAGRLAISLLIIVGITRALLRARSLLNRAEQTIAAFAGSGLLFALLVLPIALNLQPPSAGSEPSAGQFLLAVLGLFLFFWKLRIDAHIWRHALEIKRGAISLAVALMLLEVLMVAALTSTVAPPVSSTP